MLISLLPLLGLELEVVLCWLQWRMYCGLASLEEILHLVVLGTFVETSFHFCGFGIVKIDRRCKNAA